MKPKFSCPIVCALVTMLFASGVEADCFLDTLAEGSPGDAARLHMSLKDLEAQERKHADTHGLAERKLEIEEQNRNAILAVAQERSTRLRQTASDVQAKIQELNQRFNAGEDRGRLLVDIQALIVEIDWAKAFDINDANSLSVLGVSDTDPGSEYDPLKDRLTRLLGTWQRTDASQPIAADDIWFEPGEKGQIGPIALLKAEHRGELSEYMQNRTYIEEKVKERKQEVEDMLTEAFDDAAFKLSALVQADAQSQLDTLWLGDAGIPFSKKTAEEMVRNRIGPLMMRRHGIRPEIVWVRRDEDHPNYNSWFGSGDIPKHPTLIFKDAQAERRVISSLQAGGKQAGRMASMMTNKFHARDFGFVVRGSSNPNIQSKEKFFRWQIQKHIDNNELDPKLMQYVTGSPNDVDEVMTALEKGEGTLLVPLGEDLESPVMVDFTIDEGELLDILGKLIVYKALQDSLLPPVAAQ